LQPSKINYNDNLIDINTNKKLFTNVFNNHFINFGKKITESIQKDRISYENSTSLYNTKQNIDYIIHECKLDYTFFTEHEVK